ncbi:MAG: hypothetical protein JST00_47165 [Deltaproteobacteria bacterium]|nr:hypothetical protein [Deltaproteobacteria bacterium]
MRHILPLLLLAVAFVGCRAPDPPGARASARTAEVLAASSEAPHAAPPVVAPASEGASAKVTAVYPWRPTATERLDVRFPAPDGFMRADAAEGTFAAFLRTLPLLPRGAKVVDYRGAPLYDDGRHPNIAAVVDIDVGHRDLQQCADAIIRLHAEWRYGRGDRDIAYRALSGTSIPYARYVAGERAVIRGNDLVLARTGTARTDEHALFRTYLDDVFQFASTRSLERDAVRVVFPGVLAGDFFVMTGQPFGHAVLILDVAKDERGRLALLLGQSFMPAQSFQILQPDARSAWFVVEPGATEVKTPFWPAFSTEMTRRL